MVDEEGNLCKIPNSGKRKRELISVEQNPHIVMSQSCAHFSNYIRKSYYVNIEFVHLIEV